MKRHHCEKFLQNLSKKSPSDTNLFLAVLTRVCLFLFCCVLDTYGTEYSESETKPQNKERQTLEKRNHHIKESLERRIEPISWIEKTWNARVKSHFSFGGSQWANDAEFVSAQREKQMKDLNKSIYILRQSIVLNREIFIKASDGLRFSSAVVASSISFRRSRRCWPPKGSFNQRRVWNG